MEVRTNRRWVTQILTVVMLAVNDLSGLDCLQRNQKLAGSPPGWPGLQ